ncbi:MAG: hypothetical protein RR333_06235 [Bacteroidales bacterium]
MKHPTFFIHVFFLLSLTLCLSVSCKKQEYNLSNGINKTIQVGGDSLMFPIGSTDSIRLKDLIGDSALGNFFQTLPDGSYALSLADQLKIEVPTIDRNSLRVPDIIGESHIYIPIVALSSKASFTNISIDTTLKAVCEDTIPFNIHMDNLPSEIYSIDSLVLEQATMNLNFELRNLSNLGATDIRVDFTIEFPKELQFDPKDGLDANNHLHIRELVQNNKISKVLHLHRLDMDGSPLSSTLDLNRKMIVRGAIFLEHVDIAQLPSLLGTTIDFHTKYAVTHILPRAFYGKVNPQIPQQVASIAIANIPEMFKGPDIYLDFANPHLSISAKCNSGVPLKGDIKITPFLHGVGDESAAQNISITLPKSNTGEIITTSYYVAKTNASMPAGYTFIPADLSTLLHHIPDSLQLSMSTHSELNQEHQYDFNVVYSAKANYEIVVPLSFGPDLNIVYTDTMAKIPKIISTILAGSELILGGEIYNTLPLDLQITLIALDSNNKLIPIESSTQLILSGNAAGQETSTALNLCLKDPQSVLKNTPIASFILKFTGKTGKENQGVPLYQNSYIRAVLKARLIGGIIIDLGNTTL